MSFLFILTRGTAAPSKEGRGSTTQRKRGSQRWGEGTTAPKNEGSPLLFGGAPFLLLLGVGVFFPLSPLGGADVPPLPCWVVPILFFFLKKKNTIKKNWDQAGQLK